MKLKGKVNEICVEYFILFIWVWNLTTYAEREDRLKTQCWGECVDEKEKHMKKIMWGGS